MCCHYRIFRIRFIVTAKGREIMKLQKYLETYDIDNIKDAKQFLKTVVDLYNSERPHMSISNFTPNSIHHSKTTIKTERL